MICNITSKELADIKAKNWALRIIDVRTKGERDEDGSIAGSEWMDMSSRDFMANISALPKDKPYLLYCASGGRSEMALAFMEGEGFEKLYNLSGGMLGWRGEEK